MTRGIFAILLRLAPVVSLLASLLTALPAAAATESAASDCAPSILRILAMRGDAVPPAPTAVDWQAVTLPDVWSARWPGYSGSVWYRIDWRFPCAATRGREVAFAVDSISMAGEVFSNTDLLWRDRHLVEPLSRSWASPRYWLLPASSLRPDGVGNAIYVRVVGVSAQNPGLGTIALGDPPVVRAWHEDNIWRARILFMLNIAVSTVLGLMALIIWLPDRRDSVLGWYALVSGCWVVFGFNTLTTETWPFPDSLTLTRVNHLAYVGFVAAFCVFIWRLTRQTPPRWVERGLALCTASAAIVILFSPGWSGMQTVATSYTLIFFGITLSGVWHAARTRRADAIVVAVCLLLMAAIGIRDALVLRGLWESRNFYAPYTSLLFMLMALILISRRMRRDTLRIRRFNEELNDTVASVRADLRATLEEEHLLALDNVRLQERLQLAHDLHDSLGGQIVRSIMLVDQAARPLEKPQFLSMLKLLRDDLRQLVDSGASIAAATPETPAEWASPLRYRFGNLFDELDIAGEWRLPPHWPPSLPSALQCLLLARVTEEALTNVLKHSRAGTVAVVLGSHAAGDGRQRLVLRIEDDGIGFDVAAIRRSGLGIGMFSMQARMERMGGTLEVASRPGATVLTATLPLGGLHDEECGEECGEECDAAHDAARNTQVQG